MVESGQDLFIGTSFCKKIETVSTSLYCAHFSAHSGLALSDPPMDRTMELAQDDLSSNDVEK